MISKIKSYLMRPKIKRTIKKYENISKFHKKTLNYVFIPNKKSNKLLIIFSAFPPDNQAARYNYLSSFINLKCNQLYILDNFGPNPRGGSYYLGENGEFDIKDAVEDLINKLVIKNQIDRNEIICTGTSKGGYASIYFTVRNNFKAAIVGAPQFLLGNYLNENNHKIFLNYIMGGTSTNSVNELNEILKHELEKNNFSSKIYIHVGDKEPHYSEHVLPMVEFMKKKGISNYELNTKPYTNHNEVGKYFPNFSTKLIKKIFNI